MDISKFFSLMKNVDDWNIVSRNFNTSFNKNDLKNQTDYINEEINETLSAIKDNDIVELVDGLADVFVTLSYKLKIAVHNIYLNDEQNSCYDDLLNWVIENNFQETKIESMNDVEIYLHELKKNNLNNSSSIYNDLIVLYYMMKFVGELFSIDMIKAIELVMQSNWSKFPLYVDDVTCARECKILNETYSNVVSKIVTYNDKQYVIYRDNLGNGKVRKPSTYHKPDFSSLEIQSVFQFYNQ
jgi:hypothetical protein